MNTTDHNRPATRPRGVAPRHHPSADLLLDHAVGAMGPGPRLALAIHLSACADCRRRVALTEAVGGVLLSSLPQARMAPEALDFALARIERPAPQAPARDAPPRADWIEVPALVREAAHRRRRWAAPGVWVAPVIGGARGRRAYLLRVAAGMAMPVHTHRGSEMTVVLKGAFTDRAETFGPGDFAECDGSVTHRPTASAAEECVCLAAVDNSLIALDWVGRLFQSLVRI
jgi:putative transcriptional regulator